MSLGEDFRDTRLKADLSLKEAAKGIKRSIATVQQIEWGKPVSDRTKANAEAWIKKHSPEPKEGG